MKERRRSCGHTLNAGRVATALFHQCHFYRHPHSLVTQIYFVERDDIFGLVKGLAVSFFLKRKRKRMGLEKETKAEESFPPAGL